MMTRRSLLTGTVVLLLAAASSTFLLTTKKESESRQAIDRLFATTLDDERGQPQAVAQWRGKILVVNFWATWCPPCRAEHPVLKEMAAKGVRIGGVNIMDDDQKALDYLANEGNPFIAVATDPNGRNRVEWGVTAPPETFIVAGDGTVLFRFVGPLVGSDYQDRFVPELEKALAGQK